MAKGSKSRRGQGKRPGEPEAAAGPEELSPEAAPEPADAAPEPSPGEEEAAASPETPVHEEGERETASEDLTAPAEHDEPAVADEADEPGVAPEEPEIAEGEAAPEPYQTEPERAEPGRRSSRTWIAGGLILVLAVAAVGSAWFYGTYGEEQLGWVTAGRLDAVSERVDALATQVEAQAGRVGATEQAVEGVSAETSRIAERIGAVENALQELRSTAEANRQRLDEVAASIERLQSAAGEGPGDGAAAGELQSTVEALAGRVEELEQGQGQDLSALTQTIERLEQEIADLRSQAETEAQQTEQAGSLSRAYAALSERVAAGEPFADELERVAAQLPGAPGLDVLQPLAADGVATVSELQAELARIADSLGGGAEEADGTDAGGDLWASLRERLQGAVTIRRADEADWAAVLARADEALQAGDIDAAVMEVEQASDDPPPDIESWLAEATRARDAEAALDELSTVVMRQLAGQG